jgi:peptidoglycan/LPS O-acetylase OafA/YrhL
VNDRAPRPILAIVATVVWGILTVPGFLIAAAGAPMAFDAPGSNANPLVWLIVFAFLAFPVACVASIAASWITWRMPKVRVAMACIPLLPIATIVAAMALSSGLNNPFGPMTETPVHQTAMPQAPAPQASSILAIPTVPPESSR